MHGPLSNTTCRTYRAFSLCISRSRGTDL